MRTLRQVGRFAGGIWLVCLTAVACGEPVAEYQAAIEFYRNQQWQPAVEGCEQFLLKYPDHDRAPSARLYLGQSLLHLKHYDAAREQFRKFLESSPGHPDRPLAMYRVGECSFLIGDSVQARDVLRQFLNHYGGHALTEWALAYLGEAEMRLNEPADAQKTFQLLLAKFPASPLTVDARFGLAKAFEAQRDSEAALEIYRQIASQQADPRAAEAQFHIGSRLFNDGRYREAAAAFDDLLKRFPESSLAALASLNAGYAEFRLERFREAIPCFERAEENSGQAAAAQFWIGLAQKSLGNYAEASRTWALSFQKHPDHPYAERLLLQWGDSELRQGNPQLALELFQKLMTRWPEGDLADDALHAAGESALQAQQLETAQELHEQFVRQFPESPLRQVDRLLEARIQIARGERLPASSPEAGREFEQAAGLLKAILAETSLDQTRNHARLQLARISERQGRDDDEIRQLTTLLSGSKSMPGAEQADALLMRANAFLRQSRLAEAAQDFDAAAGRTSNSPQRALALSGLAGVEIRQANWQQVHDALNRLLEADPQGGQFSRNAVAAGDAAFERQDWETAAGFFREVTARFPNGAYLVPALSGLAHCEYERRNFGEAAALFENLEQHSGRDVVLRSHAAAMRSLALQQAGEPENSLQVSRRAVEELSSLEFPDPETETKVRENIVRSARCGANVARELNQSDAAAKLYQSAYEQIKRLPAERREDLDGLLNEWADLSYTANDFQRADELFTLLVAECPDSHYVGGAKLILAESLRFNGHTEQARVALTELADSPRSDDFIRQRALVHLLDLAAADKNWEETQRLAERLGTGFSDSTPGYYAAYRRGEALLQQQQYEEAVRVLSGLKERLTKLEQPPPAWWLETWLLLAESQLGKHDNPGAEQTVADLRTRGGDSLVALRGDMVLGRSLENRNLFDEARAAYARVIEAASLPAGSEIAAEAQFRIGETFLRQKNPAAALAEYGKVHNGYEAPRFESAALFQAAACELALQNKENAADVYRTLIAEFPESDYAEQARQRLAEISNSAASDQPAKPAVP